MGGELLWLSVPQIIEWFLKIGELRKPPQLPEQNEQIRQRYALGEGLSELARAFSISPQRAWQIINYRRK